MQRQLENKKKLCIAVSLIAAAYLVERKRITKKKRKTWVNKWLQTRTADECYENLMRELVLEDTESYRKWIRMDTKTFEYLLENVTPLIGRNNTQMRESISAGERLALTLRYLAKGESQKSLSFQFHIAGSTISKIVNEVSKALFSILKEKYLTPPRNSNEWKAIASEFAELWNFPLCIGALDGRHLNTESSCVDLNYVLFALVDAHFRFIYVDVNHSGVFDKSKLFEALSNNTLNIPEATNLPSTTKNVPHVIVADDAFPFTETIMKPYDGKNLSKKQQIFNYRLSRAFRVADNAFGILASRFQIHKYLRYNNIRYIVLATCALHNLLCERNSDLYIPHRSIDVEDCENKRINLGYWRNEISKELLSLEKNNCGGKRSARDVRKSFLDYFNGPGIISWQNDMCNLD